MYLMGHCHFNNMRVPKSISNLIDSFASLPGIGPKTAQRLTFYLLHFPEDDLKRFAEALVNLKLKTKLCEQCKNVGDGALCEVCLDNERNKQLIAVVAGPLDVFALEKAGFKGLYHVLHGVIDPLNNIGPDELFISSLIPRISQGVKEVILATNTSMEGESTAMYLTKIIRDAGYSAEDVSITRLARGLPVGGDIEYADDITLSRALEGRSRI